MYLTMARRLLPRLCPLVRMAMLNTGEDTMDVMDYMDAIDNVQ